MLGTIISRAGGWGRAACAVSSLLVIVPVIASVWLGSWLPCLAVVAVVFALVSICRPVVPLIVMMLVWGGPVETSEFTKSVGGLHVGLAEFSLILGLIAVVAARLVNKGPIGAASRPRFFAITVFYLIAVLLGLVRAQFAGDRPGASASAWIVSCTVLAYFVLSHVYRGRPRRFAETLVVLTGLSCVVVLLATAFHITLLTGPAINYVTTGGHRIAATRLDPPLLRILSITLLMATIGGVLSKRRPRLRALLIAAMLGVEALSFTRSTWLPLIAVAALLPALISRRFALVAAIRRLLVAALLITIVVVASVSGLLGPTARSVGERFTSTTQSDVLDDNSVQLRVGENQAAWNTIKEHPVLGVGFPRPYGAFTTPDNDPVLGDVGSEPQRFIHNVYLGLWAWMGLAGVCAMLFTAVAGARAFISVLRTRAADRRPALACFGGLLVLAISSTFQTNLLYQPALFAIAAGLAYLDVWLHSRGREEEHRFATTLPLARAQVPPSRPRAASR